MLARAWRALSGWFAPDNRFGSPGVVNPPCPLGDYLNPDITAALSLPAVARAIACYADSVASLPRRVVRRSSRNGLEVDTSSDAANLLASVSYYDLEGLAASCIAFGNSYAVVERNSRGGASGLVWIPSHRVQPVLDERSRLYYRIAADASMGELERTLPALDVIHIRFRATGAQSRYVGVSPLQLCAPAVAMALRAQALQAELFRNVSAPAIYMRAPHKISKELADRLRTEWGQSFGAGTRRRGSTAVLGEGLEVGTVSVGSAVDAEMSKQFEFGVAEVARVLGVPLTLLQQPAGVTHGASIEESRSFASMSLAPFCHRVADELATKLLTDTQRASGWSVEFDLSAMLISPAEVADRYSKLCNGGVATVNECREALGLPDVDDGDELRVPVNVAPLSRWIDGNTPGQQLAHEDTPANPQPEASAPRPLRAVSPQR